MQTGAKAVFLSTFLKPGGWGCLPKAGSNGPWFPLVKTFGNMARYAVGSLWQMCAVYIDLPLLAL